MIVPAGVLVDAADAGEVVAALAEHVRRTRRDTLTLRRVIGELERVVATSAATSGRTVAPAPPVWVDLTAASGAAGRPRRTVSRWCAEGSILARKDGNRWLVATEHGGLIWRTGSSARSRAR